METKTQPGPRGPILDLAVHSHVVSPGMPTQVDGPPPDASLVLVVSCRSRLEPARRDHMLRELAHAWAGELALIAESISASMLGGDAAWIPATSPGRGGAADPPGVGAADDEAPTDDGQASPGLVVRPVIEVLDPVDDASPPGVTLTLEVQDVSGESVGKRISSLAACIERARPCLGRGARWREVEVHDRRSAAPG